MQIEPYPTLLLEADYVGSKGARLLRLDDGNSPQPTLVAQLEAFCVPTNPRFQTKNTYLPSPRSPSASTFITESVAAVPVISRAPRLNVRYSNPH
jgi:hypothetical protein